VRGDLQVQDNTVPTAIDSNSVGSNPTDQNNNAASQVFSNAVTGNLQCSGNSAITGGKNKPAANRANARVSKARCLALLLDEPCDRIHQIKFGENFELLVRHFHKYCGTIVAQNMCNALNGRI